MAERKLSELRDRREKMTTDEYCALGNAETLAYILSEVGDEHDREWWEPSDNVRLTEDGTVNVSSLTNRQFEFYYGLLEDSQEDDRRLGHKPSEKDLKAWRAVRKREIRENREARERARMPLNRLKYAGVRVLASPIMLLAWIFDAFSSGRHTGVARTRGRAVVQGGGNRLMAAVIMLLLALPLLFLATGDRRIEGTVMLLAIPETLLMLVYAPWYTLLGLVPYWYAWAAIDGLAYGSYTSERSIVMGIWVWSLYPLLRGLCHNARWERERKAGKPNHPTTRHPVALGVASIGAAMAGHYFFRRGKKG